MFYAVNFEVINIGDLVEMSAMNELRANISDC